MIKNGKVSFKSLCLWCLTPLSTIFHLYHGSALMVL